MAKKIIPYNVNSQFMKIEWNGDNGIGEYGRIAFLPRSCKRKVYGEKVSFVFRGVGYKDYPYHIEQRKGYYIALPVDYLNDVELKVELGDIIVKEGNIFKLGAAFIYSKRYRDEIYSNKFYKYERISLRDIEGKNSADVISWLFNVDKSIVEVCDKKLCEFEERQGYVTYVYEVFTENNIFKIKKTGQYKNYRCMPFDQLLEEFKSLKVDVEAHYTKEPESLKREGWESSYLHECLENCVWVKIKEPICLDKCFKLTLDEFQNLREKSKIQIDELEMRKIHGKSGSDYYSIFHYWEDGKLKKHYGYYSFDDFLEQLRDYDKRKVEKEMEFAKKRLDEILQGMHYYVKISKEEILKMFQKLMKVSITEEIIVAMSSDEYRKEKEINEDYKKMQENINKILQKIGKEAWVKVLSIKSICDGMYIESKEEISIINRENEIQIYHKRYNDGYEEESGEFIKDDIRKREMTEEQLEKQEKERKQEIQRLKENIKSLEEKKKYLEKKSLKDLYNNIVKLFQIENVTR